VTSPAIVAVAGFALAASGAAHALAADARLAKELRPLISKSCVPTSQGLAEIKAGPLADALLSKRVVTFDTMAPLVGRPGSELAPKFMDAAAGDNREAYLLIGGTVRGWTVPTAIGAGNFLPLDDGGIEVRARDGKALAEADTSAVLAAILDRNDSRYRFVCRPSAELSSPPPDGSGVGMLLIAKEPTDLTIPRLTNRPFAEFAYLRDEDAKTDTFSFYGTLGLGFGDRAIGRAAFEANHSGAMLRVRPLVFTQLEYERAGNAGTAKVDNLNFGAEIGGNLQTRGARTNFQFWTLNARYLTDTRFASSGWSTAAKWTPYFGLPGNLVPYSYKGVEFTWRLTGVGDHAGFSDIGRKTELANAPHYTRLGLDAAAELSLPLAGGNSVSLDAGYGLRENLERGPGNVRRSTIRLIYKGSDNVAVGIGYDRGRNIDTLEHTRTVKLTIGIRR